MHGKNEYTWAKSVSGEGFCPYSNNMYVSQDSPFRVWIWKLNKKTVDGKRDSGESALYPGGNPLHDRS